MAAAWDLSDSHASESDSDSDSSDSSDDPIGRLDSDSQDSVAAMWDSAAAAMHPNVQSAPAVLPGLAQDPVIEKPLPAIVIEEKPPPAAVVGRSFAGTLTSISALTFLPTVIPRFAKVCVRVRVANVWARRFFWLLLLPLFLFFCLFCRLASVGIIAYRCSDA